MPRNESGTHFRFCLQPVIQCHAALKTALFSDEIDCLGDHEMPFFRSGGLLLLMFYCRLLCSDLFGCCSLLLVSKK